MQRQVTDSAEQAARRDVINRQLIYSKDGPRRVARTLCDDGSHGAKGRCRDCAAASGGSPKGRTLGPNSHPSQSVGRVELLRDRKEGREGL